MTITIVASGSRGDVQPYIALGKGLKAAGHDVRLLSSEDFAGLAAEAGLDFRPVGTSIEAMMQSDEWRQLTESGNFLKILSGMQTEMRKHAQMLAESVPDQITGCDLIVTGLGGLGGTVAIADAQNIPLLMAYVLPVTPTAAFPSPLTPRLPLGNLLNRPSYHVMRQMLWQSTRAADVATRKALGLPKGSMWGPFRALNQRRLPTLYGYSRHVLPQPDDWPAQHRVTGYWFLDAAADWAPPDELARFLNDGPPPVYIGFGSMGSRNPAEASQIALKALALSGQRGVLASGWGGLSAADLPESVHMLRSVPHGWLFPQMAAVVHHGGAGTTAAGLRAGVPSIVIPFMADQPFWGQRVAQMGVGPAPIPRKRLTAESLAERIRQALTDTAMRQRAAALGEKIRAEDGIGAAVAAIGAALPG